MLKCSICGASVTQKADGELERSCEHSTAAVIADMTAVAYGASHVNDEE